MQAVNANQGDCLFLNLTYFCWLGMEAAVGMSGLMGGEHLYIQLTGLQLSNPLSSREGRESNIYKKPDMAYIKHIGKSALKNAEERGFSVHQFP